MAEVSVEVDAPPKRLYEMITDVSRMGEWSPETVSAQWVEGSAGPTIGAKFRGKNKRRVGWSTTCTVTAAEPGREFAFTVGKGDTSWRYRFEPSGSGAKVTESFEILREPGMMGRLLTRIGTGVAWDQREADMVKGMEQTLARLKAAAENA